MTRMMFDMKYIIAGLAIGVLLFWFYEWHYGAIKDLENQRDNVQKMLTQKQAELSQCKFDIVKIKTECFESIEKEKFDFAKECEDEIDIDVSDGNHSIEL